MSKYTLIVGKKYNNWTVLSRFRGDTGKWMAQCKCSCGSIKTVFIDNIIRGKSQSCGCLRVEVCGNNFRTHGGRFSKEYAVWCNMKSRCYNPRVKKYKNHGGRGIKVCDRWLESFENFYADIGKIPKGMTLDRIDNDGDYEPGNWRLATQREQCNNKGNNHWVAYKGETKTVAQWERHLGMRAGTLKSRLYRGWSEEKALNDFVRAKHANL
jgi:hypothetical protein